MSRMLNNRLSEDLKKRGETGLLRSLNDYSSKVDFLSNDYLGMASLGSSYLSKSGSGGSRLISGNSVAYQCAEQSMADFYGYPAALFFPSGYLANLSVFSTIPQKGDLVLYDKAIHASVRDGLRLSQADLLGFRHNDLKHLSSLLERNNPGNVYVVVEALYSMHGDMAPLKEISELCTTYGAFLIVDEAHSGGLFGPNGVGLTSELGIDSNVYLKIITFGKAYGSFGALVLCHPVEQQFLINFARPFIYSTAVPDNHALFLSERIRMDSLQLEREKVASNCAYFRNCMDGNSLISSAQSPIQIIRNSTEALRRIEQSLLEAGIAAKVIVPPTVAKGEECLRVCIHSFNTKDEIDLLCSVILQSI